MLFLFTAIYIMSNFPKVILQAEAFISTIANDTEHDIKKKLTVGT